MKAIVYVSEARLSFDTLSIESLAADAAARNVENGITGYLYYESGRFLQYIEGSDDNVDTLMELIRNDPRHHIIHEVVSADIPARRFPAWHMRSLHHGEIVQVETENILSNYLIQLDDMVRAENGYRRCEGIIWDTVDRLARSRLNQSAA